MSTEDTKDEDDGIGPILLSACKRGNMSLMKKLIDENGAKLNVNPIDGLGNGPLHYAALGDHLEIAQLLFEKYAETIDPNIQNFAGDTAVHKAVEKSHIDFLKLLVANHADTTLVNKKGRNAAAVAMGAQAREIIKSAQLATKVWDAQPVAADANAAPEQVYDPATLPVVRAELDPDMIADEGDGDD